MLNIHSFESLSALNEALAQHIIQIGRQAIARQGRFNFVLTGGSSPKTLYQDLSSRYRDAIDWEKVFFFFGDERCVLPDHRDYNGKMADQNLFKPLGVAPSHIFYIDTTLSPAQAAADYETRIQAHFKNEPIQFDLILLGMGDDAHTASIFPGTDLIQNKTENIAAVWVEKLQSYRISMTAARINQAQNIAFIVFGANKAQALQHVLGDAEQDPNSFPAQLIRNNTANVDWFIDEAAAAGI